MSDVFPESAEVFGGGTDTHCLQTLNFTLNPGVISPWGLPGSEDFPHRGDSLAKTGQIPANQVFSSLWVETLESSGQRENCFQLIFYSSRSSQINPGHNQSSKTVEDRAECLPIYFSCEKWKLHRATNWYQHISF